MEPDGYIDGYYWTPYKFEKRIEAINKLIHKYSN